MELTMARAQWVLDEDRPGAIELARSAQRRLAALESAPPGLIAEVDAWLAEPS
jgi:hypothetical protein